MTTDLNQVYHAEFARAERILVEAIGQLHFLQRFGVVSPEQIELIDKTRREIGRVVLAAMDYELEHGEKNNEVEQMDAVAGKGFQTNPL